MKVETAFFLSAQVYNHIKLKFVYNSWPKAVNKQSIYIQILDEPCVKVFMPPP